MEARAEAPRYPAAKGGARWTNRRTGEISDGWGGGWPLVDRKLRLEAAATTIHGDRDDQPLPGGQGSIRRKRKKGQAEC